MNTEWKKFCRRFTIVEVALAIAVLVLGISAIMVLFPVGLNATSNAVGDNLAGDIADSFIPYLRGRLDKAKRNGSYNNEFLKVLIDADAPNAFFTEKRSEMMNGWDIDGAEKAIDGAWKEHEKDPLQVEPIKNYLFAGDYDQQGIYRFWKVTYDDVGNYSLDFDAIIRVWTEKISGLKVENYTTDYLDYQYGAGIFVEVSWPAEKPYKNREKRVYYFEYFNQ
ncbi:hypothetical protein [Victivallis sp. Marseille-Q1083]|uniref:hypothetical protein n=1 Tax=Victivallis sp. Marseille-Q1083 TaxID=2717288 RepID=UPI00158E1416|nr:hypothetical protein [Victivallis sp. Marseille-Q1083]